MASLSPFTWIVVGLLVTVVSLFLEGLRFFAIVGVLFLIFGLARLVFARRSKKSEANHTYHRNVPGKPEAGKRKCWVCGAQNSSAANFCGHCGHRLSS